MSESKQCGKCAQVKPLEAFGRHAMTRDRLQPWCRQCQSANRRGKPHKRPVDALASPSVANGYNPSAPSMPITITQSTAKAMTKLAAGDYDVRMEYVTAAPPSGPVLTRREAEICFTAVARAAIKPDAPDMLSLLRKLDAWIDGPHTEPVPIRPATFRAPMQVG